MINIVHPKVFSKPPICKQNKCESAQSTKINNAGKDKTLTNFTIDKLQSKINNADTDKKLNVKMTPTDLPNNIAKEWKNGKKTINDCNQNVIEPNSCSFEQLCSMISDFEKNSADHSIVSEKDKIQTQEDKNQQIQAERDFSRRCENPSSTYDDIMSFLGSLEQNVTNFENQDAFSTHRNPPGTICPNCNKDDTLLKIESSALKDDLTTAKLQLEEKEATIKFLKSELRSERKSACEKLESQKKEHSSDLQNQKIKYQSVIKRHQKFIEQIISEKKDLTEKCDALAQHAKEMDAKHQREFKVIADRHAVEVQRAKELCAASEKIRRERWLEAKTTKIKEMTVKGLEPELRNMVEQHQREVQELRSVHAKELQDVELRTIRRTNQQLEQLRIELTESYDRLLNEEKEAMRKRYQEKLKEQEMLLQAQQRKFFNDLQEEKLKFGQEQARSDKERDLAVQKVLKEYREKCEMIRKKFEADKKTFEESLLAEKDAWTENNQRQYNTKLAMAEARIAEECARERDKQIELAIHRLDNETQNAKANLQKSYENKMRCLTEKYEADLQIANDKERLFKDKFDSAQKRLESAESELRRVEGNFEKSQVELRESSKLIDKLTVERDEAKKIVRQEIEQEKRDLENKVASLNQEMKKNNTNKDAIMAQIYSRIKLIVTQKDLKIKNLSKLIEDSHKRCEHLERLLDQQRKEYILQNL